MIGPLIVCTIIVVLVLAGILIYKRTQAQATAPATQSQQAQQQSTQPRGTGGLSSIAWAFWVFVILFFGVPLIGTTILMFTPQYKEQVKRDQIRRQVEATGVKMFTIMAPAGRLSPEYAVEDIYNFDGTPEDWVYCYINGSKKGVPIGPKFKPHVPGGIRTIRYMANGDMPVAVHVRLILMGDQHVTSSSR